VLKNCLNLYTRKTSKKEVKAMKKPIQNQQETHQETMQGGEAMVYFITFPSKVSAEKAKEVLAELRKRFPSQTAIFMPKPPPGKKMVLNIGGVLVIITFPYALKKNPKQEQAPKQSPTQEGFTLGELIKNKKI
jgi:hypothetical protein